MTLIQPPFMVNGGTHPARNLRAMLGDLAQANEGIVQGSHLKVTAQTTPGASVRVADGSAIVKGRFAAWQGSYHVFNVGTENRSIAATGASPRNDMVVLRIEDPEYEGTRNPASDPIAYIDIVSSVGATATTIPSSSMSAIPLARINIPANTATITDAMITSLRTIANPRRQRDLYIAQHPSTGASDNTGAYTTWPNSAVWSVFIPAWATTVKIVAQVTGARLQTGAFAGGLRAQLGSNIVTAATSLDYDAPTGTYRTHMAVADTKAIPDTDRGTTQSLRLQGTRTLGTGILRADGGTASIVDIEFYETPV